jgi:hypothetical protein
MTTLMMATGSTPTDATTRLAGSFAAGEYLSDLRLNASSSDGLLGGTIRITVSAIKNNGPFNGYEGADKITLDGATGSLNQVIDDLGLTANDIVVGFAVDTIGSPTTGSPTYYGAIAKNSYASA